jgi:hypothetical protein
MRRAQSGTLPNPWNRSSSGQSVWWVVMAQLPSGSGAVAEAKSEPASRPDTSPSSAARSSSAGPTVITSAPSSPSKASLSRNARGPRQLQRGARHHFVLAPPNSTPGGREPSAAHVAEDHSLVLRSHPSNQIHRVPTQTKCPQLADPPLSRLRPQEELHAPPHGQHSRPVANRGRPRPTR